MHRQGARIPRQSSWVARNLAKRREARKQRESYPGGGKDVPATGPGRAGKVLGFRVYTFVIATSARVITSGKQLGGSGSA